MNLRLTNVLSDITGVTGLKIIRAILSGEHNPQRLAALREPGCKKSETEIAKSLEGHYKREHLFASSNRPWSCMIFMTSNCRLAMQNWKRMYREFEPT